MTKFADERSNFGANGPFFRIIREGLEGLAAGDDYFDLLADDVVVDYIISVPGYPRHVEGRNKVIALYRDYDNFLTIHAADNLRRSYIVPAADSDIRWLVRPVALRADHLQAP